MFVLNSPNLPAIAGPSNNGVLLGTYSVSSAEATGANFGTVELAISSPLAVEGAIAIPSTEASFAVVLPAGVELVTSAIVGSRSYSLSKTPSAPQAGEFTFNPRTGELRVYPVGAVSGLLSYTGLSSEVESEGVPTTDIASPYPGFFAEWNIEGSISISRSFRGHPSASLRFTAQAAYESTVRAALKNGNSVQMYGVGYLVQSLRIVELSPRKYPQRLIFVEVNLQGRWDSRGNTARSPLDKALKLKKLSSNGKTSVSRLFGASGVGYAGPAIDIKVPNDTPSEAAVTARSELESRAIVALGFPYYSNPGAVEVRRWGGTPVHFLSDADILSGELIFDLPGHAAVFEGVQLTDEYNNVELTLDSEALGDTGQDELLTLYEGDPFPEIPPRYADVEPGQPRVKITLRDPSMAYPGGKTKTQKKVTYLNGSVLEEEEEVYGFLFSSVDVYNVFLVTDGVAARYATANDLFFIYDQYWEKVRQVRTTYHYNAETRYLERIERRGWEKARFKQEGASLEAVEFKKQYVQALADGDLATADELEDIIMMFQYPGKAAAYDQGFPNPADSQRAVFLPVEDTTEYALVPFSAHYEDAKKDDSEDEDVEPEPMFCKLETRSDNSYMLVSDPESTPEDERPPLSTGKKFQDVRSIEIVYPQPGGKQSPEIYREIQATSNAQGAALRNVLNTSYYREMKGRPGVHTQLEKYQKDSNTPAPAEDYSKYKFLLNSYGAESDADGSSISFPGVADPETGRRVAECALSILNSEKAESISLQVRHNFNYSEGDLIAWRGYFWVIFSIQDNQKIQRQNGQPKIQSESFELKLGRLFKPPVTMRKVLKDG